MDHLWQKKLAAIAKAVDELGVRFKPEYCAGWLTYSCETYPGGEFAVGAPWLSLGFYAHWSPEEDVPIKKFFAMNMHPNNIF